MAREWRIIRVPVEVANRIESLAADMMRAHVEGRASLPAEHCERVPHYHAIEKALDEVESKRERSRKPNRVKVSSLS